MSATKSEADPVASLKELHRGMWADGDYAAVARLMDEGAPAQMISAVGVDAHDRVLDVGTGTGNVALRAARSGAQVIGLDLTPELLEIAAVRAAALGAQVEWVEGDASPPPLWGSESHVRELFGAWDVELEFERAVMAHTLGSVEEWLEFYETNYGPTIRAKSLLEREGRWGECRAELAELFRSQNRANDGAGVCIEAEYMLIVAMPSGEARRADHAV